MYIYKSAVPTHKLSFADGFNNDMLVITAALNQRSCLTTVSILSKSLCTNANAIVANNVRETASPRATVTAFITVGVAIRRVPTTILE